MNIVQASLYTSFHWDFNSEAGHRKADTVNNVKLGQCVFDTKGAVLAVAFVSLQLEIQMEKCSKLSSTQYVSESLSNNTKYCAHDIISKRLYGNTTQYSERF